MKQKFLAYLFLFLNLSMPLSAISHHGHEIYDATLERLITGKVIRYKLADPHSYLYLEVATNGELALWEIEGGNASGIIRSGLSKEFLDSQPFATVAVWPEKHQDCTKGCKALGRGFNFDR